MRNPIDQSAAPREVATTPAASPTQRAPAMLTYVVWMLMVLMILPKDFVSLFHAPDENVQPNSIGSAINSLFWLGLTITGPVWVFRRFGTAKRLLKQINIYFLVFCVLVLLSVFWSADPGVTLERFRRLMVMFFCCMAFVMYGWNAHRFQQSLRPVITALLVGSLIYGLIFPHLAIHQEDSHELKNAWHGLTFQKNIFGALATYGVILWFHGWLTRQTSLIRSLLWGGASMLCVILSHSSTSLMTTAFSMFLLSLMLKSSSTLRRYTPYIITMFVVLVAAYALASLDIVPALKGLLDPITALTGKNAANATGRAPIWALIKDEINRHPWLGIGYGAYWTGPTPGTASYIFVEKIHFYAGSSHNGYLEVTNDLGYAGLACLIGYIVFLIKQSLKLWKIDRAQAALYLALFFQQGLNNLSEAEWLQVTSFSFVVITLATCSLARGLIERAPPATTAPPSPAPSTNPQVNFASKFLRNNNRR